MADIAHAEASDRPLTCTNHDRAPTAAERARADAAITASRAPVGVPTPNQLKIATFVAQCVDSSAKMDPSAARIFLQHNVAHLLKLTDIFVRCAIADVVPPAHLEGLTIEDLQDAEKRLLSAGRSLARAL